ncbi:DUF1453 family protein [Sphingomonas naphthae]|uniref:DUF1453 family protein n=1 Tax=Sphingomonas naphthae TaxID=1813468 RepID=A0ABY7TQD1_9SPHN|nr:CcdC protein domain-containing protein [Sphingomonas naphthae]WCT74891.1 DUF1453 family protein [Sphingomonas naphthae]
MPQQADLYRYGFMALVFVLVLVLRTRSLRRERPLKLEQLWIVPTLYAAVAALMFYKFPPQGLGWAWCAVALAAGCAVGWWRGTHMAITIDPNTHRLNQRGSAMAVIVIVVLIAIRFATTIAIQRGMIHVSAASLTDPLIAFALGLFSLTRLEMYLRAKRMLAEADARI